VKRTVWFLAGTAFGVVSIGKARRTAETFTYDGLTDRLVGLFAGARVFGEEVAAAAGDKETELRERYALGHNDTHAVQQPDVEAPVVALNQGRQERGKD
jgi:hypothetical protein